MTRRQAKHVGKFVMICGKKLLCYETDTDIIAFGIRKILRGRVKFPTGGDEARLTSPRLPKGTDMV